MNIVLKPSVLLMTAILFLTVACRKDLTNEADITQHTWKLRSVTTAGETFTPKSNADSREEDYTLAFVNDSVFTLYTSVNELHGKYNIPEKGKITIIEPISGTKVGTSGEAKIVDDNLLEVFRKSTTYEVLGNYLTLKGEKGQVKYKQD